MRETPLRTNHALCRYLRWLSLGLFLLVASCTNAPDVSPGTPTASGSAQSAPITTYHGHTSTVFAVAWSPDGTRIASGSNDNTIQVWNATTGKREVIYTGHLGSVWTVAWSPDGRSIASGGNDSTVQVWNAMNGHRLLTYRGQTAPIWRPRHGPDGSCLASASGDTSDEHPTETVQVWNSTTGHLIVSYPVPSSAGEASGTLSVAWSSDSARLATGGADTLVHLWSVPSCAK
jgi:eukaryotic-like serine/threonine-protein kinase